MKVHTYEFTPRFADTDAAGIIHFSKILCYVEEAEHDYLHAMGFPVNPAHPQYLQWPRIACTAEYIRPLHAFKPLHVALTIKRLGKTSLTWHWEINSEKNCYARGELKTVCCRIHENVMEPIQIPDALRQILSE